MKRPKIAVVGSYNMDLVVRTERMPRQGETVIGHEIRYIPGGKGANQAVGCARLGAEVSMIGAVGKDVFGQEIIAAMQQEGINLGGTLQADDMPTGTATIIHASQDNSIVIVPGANNRCTADHVRNSRILIEQADALIVQLEVPPETVEEAVSIARASGVRVILNPAPARLLPDSILRQIDILTPNETEFEQLTGRSLEGMSDAELADTLTEWESRFGHRVCVTRGKLGCSYVQDKLLVTAAAPYVEVADTTGAGDAFNAALAYGVCSGWSFAEAVKFAVAAASSSVTRFGAQDGMPTYEEASALLGDV